jgi:hypothetical protein
VSSSDVDGSTVSFSNTALTNFINADTNGVITLMLRRSGGNAGGTNNLAFRSKEFDDGVGDPTAPTLTITPVPEPGTLALLGAGTLALIRRRR